MGDGRQAAPAPSRPRRSRRRSERLKASPLARRISKERGIDLRRVDRAPARTGGSWPRTSSARPPAPPWEAKPVPLEAAAETIALTSIRRTIARRLSEAWQAPHFAVALSVDMRRAIELRERLVERTEEGEPRPTYSDILTKLAALALLRHPDVNAHYDGSEIHRFRTANVGMAVAIPQGLVVPVIKGCEQLSVRRDRRRAGGPRRADAFGRPEAGRPRGRHVHHLESRHVRDRALLRRSQPAAGGHPGGRARSRTGSSPRRASPSSGLAWR